MHSDATEATRTTLTHTAIETYILAAAHTHKAGLSTASYSSLGTAQLEVVEGRESIQSMRKRLRRGQLSGRGIAPDGCSTGRPEDGICSRRHGSGADEICSKAALSTLAGTSQTLPSGCNTCHHNSSEEHRTICWIQLPHHLIQQRCAQYLHAQ